MKHIFHYALVAVFISAHCSVLSIPTADERSEYVLPTLTQSNRTGERMLQGNDGAMDMSNDERGKLPTDIEPLASSSTIPKSIKIAADGAVGFVDKMYRTVIQQHPAVIHFSKVFTVDINQMTTRVQELRTHQATLKLNQDDHIMIALGGEYSKELPYNSNFHQERLSKELSMLMSEKDEIVKKWKAFFSEAGFRPNIMIKRMREFVGNSDGVDMGIEEYALMAIGTDFFKTIRSQFLSRELKPPSEKFPYAVLRNWGIEHNLAPSEIRKQLRKLEKEDPKYLDKTNEELLEIARNRVIAKMEKHKSKKPKLQ